MDEGTFKTHPNMSINKHLKDTSTFKANNSKESKEASVSKKENIQHMGKADAFIQRSA